MRWRKFSAFLILAAVAGAIGCGSSKSSTVSITISPTSASVITNTNLQYSGLVTGNSNTAITWSVTCATGVTANTCGSISAAGLYLAPATIPTITTGNTTTFAPTVTIKGTAQADTSKTATGTLTIVTGISISVTPTSATVGTTETFTFSATVNNPGCNIVSNSTCEDVTWSLPTPPASTTACPNPNAGMIGLKTGVYTAPSTVPCPSSTIIVTATSVADTSVTATAILTVVTASTPTVTSVSPNTTAVGGIFQDVYVTGTNFISTNIVYVNHAQLSPTLVTKVSSSLIRARIPDFVLASPFTSVLQVGVSEQTGAEQDCPGTDQTPCEVTLVNARPGLVGPTPASIPQGTAGVLSFGVDGGFFGTGANPASPAVTATYNGQLRGIQLPASQTIGSTRQLTVTIGGGGSNSNDFTVPGLYPVAIQNARDASKFAVANLAVQPNYNGGSSISTIKTLSATDGIGASPSDVSINPATGVAVVANTGSNDITLINIAPTSGAPAVLTSICTFAPGLAEPCPSSTPSGPTSVSVDYVRNIALVANAASKSIAVVDLSPTTLAVTSIIQLQDTPGAVGINPVTGCALVAMQQRNYGVIVDVAGNRCAEKPSVGITPAAIGIVSISTGPNTKVAVEPHLNWAVASPGGLGSVGIVDLSQQSSNVITAVSRTTNVVTVTVQSTASSPPLSVVVGDAVQVQNVQFPVCPGATQTSCPPNSPPGTVDLAVAALAPGFDGFYSVSAVGPGPNQFSYTQTSGTLADVATESVPQPASGSINYSQPVATVGLPITAQGIAINPETQQAVFIDPTSNGVVTFFSLIDQSVSPLSLTLNGKADAGTIAAAYNPLTNTLVAVNSIDNSLSVIDPSAPRRLEEIPTPSGPVAVAIDPGTNIAVVANQTDQTTGSVSVLNLGPIQAFSVTETSPKTFISTSTLGTAPSPAPQILTVIGTGLRCIAGSTSLKVRLDGMGLSTSCIGTGSRELTATVPSDKLSSAHRYAVDVFDPSTNNVTNADDFTVEQSVDVTGCSATPEPSGVAIDPEQNIAAVTLFGCNSLALINMSTGTGNTVTVGKNPIGVAVLPRLHYAVVANNGEISGTASIVDELQQSVKQTVNTGSGSIAAAADEATGEVAIANSVANTVTVVNVVNGGASTISTGLRPIAVAFNYINHEVAVAASGSNLLGISSGVTGTVGQNFSVQAPTSVIFDPVPTDCGSNSNGTTTNTNGCFIVNSSTGNNAVIVDPVSSVESAFRVGINPTAIAYNYFTSTLVSTNTGSHTVTVADLLGHKIRAVLALPPTASTNSNLALSLAFAGALQYALDVHPFTNIAVIADTANGRVLFLPLPH